MPKYTKIHAAFNRGSVGVTSMVRGPVCASSPQVHDANNSYCFQGPCWGPMRLLHQHQAHGRQALWSIVITTALSRKAPAHDSPTQGWVHRAAGKPGKTQLPWQAPAVPNLDQDSEGLSIPGSAEHNSLSRVLKLTLSKADRRHSQGRERGRKARCSSRRAEGK